MAERETIDDVIKSFVGNTAEDRAVEFIASSLKRGRKLEDILNDDYLKGKVPASKLEDLLSDRKILESMRKNVNNTFKNVLNDNDFKDK